ncbi:MAG: SLBB domain-containing protein [Candidatus Ratteibacteria bacterium]
MRKVKYLIIVFIFSFFQKLCFSQVSAPEIVQPKVTSPETTSSIELKTEREVKESSEIEGLEYAFIQKVPRKLERFGERFFKYPVSTFAPVLDVPVGPDYILGPGDELIIEIWGLIEGRDSYTIDREGGIYIPKIGRIYLWGLTFEQAKNLIEKKYKEFYKGFEINVLLGKLRTIKVFVVGEVKNPGAYEVSSLSTLFHILYLSGGPTSIGSYRKIQLYRNNKLIGETDIYEFLLTGKKEQDYKLQSQDVIFIPISGPQVSISGNVKRPGIYELKNEKTLSDLIDLAGGIEVSAYGGRIQIERIEKYKEKKFIDIENIEEVIERKKDIELMDGDFIKVLPIDPRIYNKIELVGYFKYPGEYEWKPGAKLSDFIKIENLLPEAYLDYGEIERIELPSTEFKVIPFSPVKVLKGDKNEDLDVLPMDKIVVRSMLEKIPTIEIRGEVKIPGRYSITKGERLSSVLKRAGGFKEEAFLKGAVFTRESVKKSQKEMIDKFIKIQQEMLLREISLTGILSGEEISKRGELLRQQKELISVLATQVPMGRVFIKLCEDIEKFENSEYDLILEDGDVLYIPKIPMSINVIGSVKNPGTIVFQSDKTIDYYIEKSGGYDEDADIKNIYIVRADGTAETKITKTTKIEQGDTIVVPTKIRFKGWQLAREIIDMFYKIALPIAVFLK